MRFLYLDRNTPGAEIMGPANSASSARVSYVTRDEPLHYHRNMRELCVVTSGAATLLLAGQTRPLGPNVAITFEPGELHGWRDTTPDFLALLIHEPFVENDYLNVAAV